MHRDGSAGRAAADGRAEPANLRLLCAFTGQSGAIRQAEFFVYRPSDRAALERYKGGTPIEPTRWIRATAKDVALIGSLGVRETGMLASA
jgi:citrate (Re)-synthase